MSGEVSSDDRPEKEDSEGAMEDIAEETESASVGDEVFFDILRRMRSVVQVD